MILAAALLLFFKILILCYTAKIRVEKLQNYNLIRGASVRVAGIIFFKRNKG